MVSVVEKFSGGGAMTATAVPGFTASLQALIEALASALMTEKTAGGDEAARALRLLDVTDVTPVPPPADIEALVADGLRDIVLEPFRAPLWDIGLLLPWRRSTSLKSADMLTRMPSEMATLELVGPTGLIPHETIRAGFFIQAANLAYPARTHAAEEGYVIVSGTALWQLNDAPFQAVPPGGTLLHPSFAPHATHTQDEPLLAAFRWTGDISFATYNI